jgi:hypothetical protein
MSDYAVLGLLAILGPVLVVGLIAQIALWADKPLPYDEAYELEQARDRRWRVRRDRIEATRH